MLNSDPLVPFGFVIILVIGGVILIPYLRRKSDLLTMWNTLLLGLISFTALGAIEVKLVPRFGFDSLNWYQPTPNEVRWYMEATAAFIATLLVAYYLNSPAKTFAQRRFRNLPELTAPMAFLVVVFCVVVTVASVVFRSSTFFGPLFYNLATIGAPAAGVFTFALWNRNRVNLIWLSAFIGVFVCSAIYAMIASAGRRMLLSMFLGPCLYLYWTQMRYWRPSRAVVAVGLAGVLVLAVSVIYSSFRWAGGEHRDVNWVMQHLRGLKSEHANVFGDFAQNQIEYFAQSNAHFSLLTERYVKQGALTPVPLNSLKFLLSYPIPRRIWHGKPEVVTIVMPRDAAGITTVNWGIGIAGQGIYEGGIPALMLYAVLLAFFIRCMDEPLRMQPGNPFLVYMHASALPHILAIPRGDMGTMTMEALQCMLVTTILAVVCRFIFGGKQQPSVNAAVSSSVPYRGYRAVPTSRSNS